jgi:hypothetical protein
MGNHLADSLGDDYVPIGLISYRHSAGLAWIEPLPDELVGVPEGNPIMEVLLHELGGATLLVDLAAAVGGEAPLLEAGAAHRFCVPDPVAGSFAMVLFEAVPIDLFRALLFLDESPPWTPL